MAKRGTYTPWRMVVSASRQPMIAEFGNNYEGCKHATVRKFKRIEGKPVFAHMIYRLSYGLEKSVKVIIDSGY
jgi:hypothetical protein